MLKIAKLKLRNFLSFGDYDTEIDLESLGPVLILGSYVDGPDRSNGAGKSSLLDAILWCLFGRTIRSDGPAGDNVINWDTGERCLVSITTTNGYEIIRTRKFEGKSELSLFKNGKDISVSTSRNLESYIGEIFNLDYNLFMSSVFFGQFSKSFLEQTPAKRREVLELLLGITNINRWAETAKNKSVAANTLCDSKKESVNNLEAQLATQKERISRYKEQQQEHNNNHAARMSLLSDQIKRLASEIEEIDEDDLKKQKKRWELIEELEKTTQSASGQLALLQSNLDEIEIRIEEISELSEPDPISINLDDIKEKTEETRKLSIRMSSITLTMAKQENAIATTSNQIEEVKQEIKEVSSEEGTECSKCGQIIAKEHVKKTIEIIKTKLDELRNELTLKKQKLGEQEELLEGIKQEIDRKKPSMTVKEAELTIEEYERDKSNYEQAEKKLKELEKKQSLISEKIESIKTVVARSKKAISQRKPSLEKEEIEQSIQLRVTLITRKEGKEEELERLNQEDNPYDKLIAELESDIEETASSLADVTRQHSKLLKLADHLHFIHRAYADRNKIKKYIISGLIPLLNKRLAHYLQLFEIETEITFTGNLQVKSGKWGFANFSGGERKRIDLALMFAMHELYRSVHGPQCNFMVFDEVDGRLDALGISLFVDVVLEQRGVDTTFVISHKNEMTDAFPSKLIVNKLNGFSHIGEIIN